uniref:Catalase core domain-containing protein n=2 Tax=Bionectria ochroleuca TaxID=29856 RepID=A0A0B7KRB5_BIOOC
MPSYYTLAEGCPQARDDTSVQLRDGANGGGLVLLQDTQLIETLANFSRERIPERVVHAKAAGAYGEFEVTHDCGDITSASFLNRVAKKTKCLVPERGSADTVRDVHGWAMKLYTDEGNLDWVFNNTPVFFVRDPIKFPSLNRSHKRNPRTNTADADMLFTSRINQSLIWASFHVGNPEGIHELMHLFSDRGTPASLRMMPAFSGHTYKFTKEDGTFSYVKVHIKPQLGIKNFDRETATKVAGENPDYLVDDLYNAIAKGDYPKWNVYVQVLTPKQAEGYKWNIFDMTKVWPYKDVPLRQIGVLTLNENPNNYFTDIEQAAFSPSTMVPGWAPSADPMLQARMFAYPDAARYRLGTNYQMLPTNHAKVPVHCPYQRDGFMNFTNNYNDEPNYVGSQLKPMAFKVGSRDSGSLSTFTEHERWTGQVLSYTSNVTALDFEQATSLWEVIGREHGHQERFISNVAAHIAGVTDSRLRSAVYQLFAQVDKDLGSRIHDATEAVRQ